MVQQITPRELHARLETAEPPALLDVREPWEQDIARLPGALEIPMNDVPGRLEELPRDRDIVVICRSGGRSARMAEYLDHMGYRVANLTGGMLGWIQDVDSSLKRF